MATIITLFLFFTVAIGGINSSLGCSICPNGFVQAGLTCLHYNSNVRSNITDAAHYCSSQYSESHLVSFPSRESWKTIKAFINTNGPSNFWTNGIHTGSNWTWLSGGTLVDWNSLGHIEPPYEGNNSHLYLKVSSAGNISLAGINDTNEFIPLCEYRSFVTILGKKSDTTAQALSTASCPGNYSAINCDCVEWTHCAGSKFVDQTCEAYNKNGGYGVQAYVACTPKISCNDRYKNVINFGGWVMNPEVTCPEGTTMVGCSSYTKFNSVKPSYLENATCKTTDACTQGGCQVQARCQVLHCGRPTGDTKGRILSTTSFYSNETVQLSCQNGYAINSGGIVEIQCQSNGSWSGILGNCIEQNECDSSPCHNGGTCTNLIDGYTCNCTGQYEGSNCETGITTTEVPGLWSTPDFINSTYILQTSNYTNNTNITGYNFDLGDLDLEPVDDTPVEAESARTLGWGIMGTMAALIGILVLSDLGRLYRDFQQAYDNFEYAVGYVVNRFLKPRVGPLSDETFDTPVVDDVDAPDKLDDIDNNNDCAKTKLDEPDNDEQTARDNLDESNINDPSSQDTVDESNTSNSPTDVDESYDGDKTSQVEMDKDDTNDLPAQVKLDEHDTNDLTSLIKVEPVANDTTAPVTSDMPSTTD